MARLLLILLVAVGCSSKSTEGNRPRIGGDGKLLASGTGSDLRLSPDRSWGAFLLDAKRPALPGLAPTTVLGELVAVPFGGGALRKLGPGVTNAPGGFAFSPDSKWLFYLQGYNPAAGTGELRVMDLRSNAPSLALGSSVSFVTLSPDSTHVAFVDGGVLKLTKLGEATSRNLGGEVRVAQFNWDSKGLVYRRSLAAGGALMFVSLVESSATPTKLGEKTGDFSFSKDGRYLAFTVESPGSRDIFDLYVTRTDKPAPAKVAKGTDVFAFSPDSQWLGRTEGTRPDHRGELVVGPPIEANGRKMGEKVERFSFSPTSDAVVAFEKHSEHPRLGSLRLTELSKGEPRVITAQADSYEWSRDGKFVAFNVEVYRPLPAVNLYWHKVGAEKPTKIGEGIYGFSFAPKSSALYYRTECTKGEGGVMPRSCELKRLDLAQPTVAAKTVASGIYSFKVSDDETRLLVTMVRSDSDAYDTAVHNLQTAARKTLDEHTLLPPHFISAEGKRVVYLISGRGRAGLYVAELSI